MAESKTIQVLQILKEISDEDHTVTKTEILEAMKKDGCATTENPATLSAIIEDILRQINPKDYTPDKDSEFKIKYRNYDKVYDNNKSILDLQEEKRELKKAKRRQNANMEEINAGLSDLPSKVPPITDLQYIHLFSKEEMDRLISAIAFTDFISADEKVVLIRKIFSTASEYYENPLFDRNRKKLRFDSRAVFGRKNKMPSKSGNDAFDIGKNVGLIQRAINNNARIGFRYNRYNAEGSLVPNEKTYAISPYHIVVYHDMFFLLGKTEDKEDYWHFRIDLMSEICELKDKNGKPMKRLSSVRREEWNPEKYMSEHLYMGYDTPRHIKIKIARENYTVLHNWFGDNFRKLRTPCEEEGYDYVDVVTSPSLIVQWAMQYSDTVEIMDEDIREKIRDFLKKSEEKYKK
ncbi:MAG: helix-turn-helix transcriptional regulator [Oscillospiraceae bacterium]